MKGSNLLLPLVAALTLSTTAGHAQSDFNWRQFEGSKLHFLAHESPWLNVTRPFIEQFEAETGIDVEVEALPEGQAWDKIKVEMQAGSNTIDAYIGQIDRFGVQFSTNGWYEPLETYINDPALTSPDFEWNDFREPSRNVVTFGGHVVGIPIDRVNGPVVVYRKDIVEQCKLELPKSLEDFEVVAKKANECAGIPGMVMRGSGAPATSQFAPVLHEFGGRWQDADGKPQVNTPEAVAAFEWWGRILRESGNPNASTFGFPETVNEFLTGNAAFVLEGAVASPQDLNDPAKSSVVGKVGYMVLPNGPGGDQVRKVEPCKVIGPFAISISAFSENKKAAWLLTQWLVGKEAQLAFLLSGRLVARNSPQTTDAFLQDPNIVANKEFWDATLEASTFCYATVGNAPPSIVDVGRAREIVGQVIVTSILGGDVKAAADEAQRELEELKASQ